MLARIAPAVAGLFVFCLCASIANAQGTSDPASSARQTQLPAVDRVNGVFEAVGGSVSGRSLYASGGLLAVPLAHSYGMEVIGAGGSYDERGLAHTGFNFFWRDPARGRIGIESGYTYWDSPIGGYNGYRVGGRGELYFNRLTLGGAAGASGHASLNGTFNGIPIPINVPSKTGFYDDITLSYYPIDNVRLSIGQAYESSRQSLTLGAEWGIPLGKNMAGLFVTSSLQSGNQTVLAGLHFYIGNEDKTLIRRNREDDQHTLVKGLVAISAVGEAIQFISWAIPCIDRFRC